MKASNSGMAWRSLRIGVHAKNLRVVKRQNGKLPTLGIEPEIPAALEAHQIRH